MKPSLRTAVSLTSMLMLHLLLLPGKTTVFADDNGNKKTGEKPAKQLTLGDAEFRQLHAALQPKADEPWRTIPWKISLLDAQRVAAETKKPLFIWAMDGHPLGCT